MNDFAKLALLVAATMSGTLFSLWTSKALRGWISGFVLLGISVLVATSTDHPLRLNSPFEAWLGLAAGLAFGLSFPCCGGHSRVGSWAYVGIGVVVFHCLLDGHIVHEATTTTMVVLFCIHKFLDGADVRILSLDNQRATWVARALVVLATPIGFLAIPGSAIPPALHMGLFACVIGFNLGTAFHVFRHEFHVRAASQAHHS